MPSLVGSEMCIRDRKKCVANFGPHSAGPVCIRPSGGSINRWWGMSPVRWHTTDNLRPNHTDTTPTPTPQPHHTHTTTTPHQHHNFFFKKCGVGVVWPHHTDTTLFEKSCGVGPHHNFFKKCGVGVVWVWCGCGVGVVWVWFGRRLSVVCHRTLAHCQQNLL